MPDRTPSLLWRILARQLPLLVVLFAGVLVWLGLHLRSVLYAMDREIAESTNAAVVQALKTAMRSEQSHQVWDRIVEQVPRYDATHVQVIGLDGRTRFSTVPGERGQLHRLDDAVCARCHPADGSAPAREAAVIEVPGEGGYQILVAPLDNDEGCRSCHRDAGRKLGVVVSRRSLEPIHAQVRGLLLALVAAGGVALLLMLLSTRWLLGRHLDRPITRLVEGARRIGAGDFGHRIELTQRTELTLLAEALNSSTLDLAEMIHQLEKQRDDFETLYQIADQIGRTIRPEERHRRAVDQSEKILRTGCVLVHATREPPRNAEDTLTFRRDDGELAECRLSDDLERAGVPDFFDRTLVERWRQGAAAGEVVITGATAVAFPLRRHGRSLGLVMIPTQATDEDPAGLRWAPNPELVLALRRHLGIALEYSELQGELIAQARLAAIGETVAGLSHCLKNVLNGLRAGQYLIDRAVETHEQERLETGWRIMKNSVRRIEQLTLNMLYYVKDREPRREPVDLNATIEEVIGGLREAAAQQGVTLAAELDKELGEAPLDRTAVYRALLNLAGNAVDACLDSEHGDRVVLRSRATPGWLEVEVEDNGSGMSEAIQARLFTRFFSTKASKGTGLGLTVVQKIAEEHGGTVEVESELGRGSIFRLRLPRVAVEEGGPRPACPPGAPAGGRSAGAS